MQAEVNARKAISKNARLLARAVGAEAPIWVELLHRIPPKSEPLLLNMLLTLTGTGSMHAILYLPRWKAAHVALLLGPRSHVTLRTLFSLHGSGSS